MIWKVAAAAVLLSPGLLLAMPHESPPGDMITIADLPGKPWLTQDNGKFLLDLGTVGPGDILVFPRAFALVNEADARLAVAGIHAEGPLAPMITVYASHGKRPSSQEVRTGEVDRATWSVLWDGRAGAVPDGKPLELAAGDGDPATAGNWTMKMDASAGVYVLSSGAEDASGDDLLIIGVMLHPPAGTPDGKLYAVLTVVFASA